MSKSCGGCQFFQKWKNDRFSGGVCLLLDQRTDTDRGRNCSLHKGIPYDRKARKNDLNREINWEGNND